jgi:hypothetical protein
VEEVAVDYPLFILHLLALAFVLHRESLQLLLQAVHELSVLDVDVLGEDLVFRLFVQK